METKKFEKVAQCRKKLKGGPLVSSGFVLRLKSKKRKRAHSHKLDVRFPGNRLVEQIEQKFRRIRDCLKEKRKKRVAVIVGPFY